MMEYMGHGIMILDGCMKPDLSNIHAVSMKLCL